VELLRTPSHVVRPVPVHLLGDVGRPANPPDGTGPVPDVGTPATPPSKTPLPTPLPTISEPASYLSGLAERGAKISWRGNASAGSEAIQYGTLVDVKLELNFPNPSPCILKT
jgi:hypothetical protein